MGGGLVDTLASVFVLLGAGLVVIAAIGLVRMPDVLMRMHASTKAGTLGAGFVMLGTAIGFEDTGASARAIGALAFLLLTAPVAAHMIGRAAYRSGVRLSPRTWIDERRGRGAGALPETGPATGNDRPRPAGGVRSETGPAGG
ncbi:MAG: monovalent cation/H(+) antiporter subunit G [Paracoccaceae bacterium]